MTVTSRPWVSVVIPIKDERDNLPPLSEQLLKGTRIRSEPRSAPFEIVYIDDGSSHLLDNSQRNIPKSRSCTFDRNYGQTSAFYAGVRQASGELIVTMGGDLHFDPADIPTLLPLSSRYDLVCGRRKDRHDNIIRKISSRIAYLVRSSVTGDVIHDTGCFLKIFRRAVKKIRLFHGMHRFFPDAWIRYHQVPIKHFRRAYVYSK